MDNNDLLYTNSFIKDPERNEVDDTDAVNFRRWYENRRKEQNVEELNRRLRENESVDVDEIDDIHDLTGTNPFNKKANNLVPKNFGTQRRIKKDRRTVVSIDSRNRNKEIFPRVNKFSAFLGKTFKNVKSIKLMTTEFPNTEGVIKSGVNNKVYWRNEEDIDLNYPVYSIEVRPGSYTATSLTTELESKFDLVKRRNGAGQFHYFDVKIDLDTDIVTFRSFIIKDIQNNPVTTAEGTGIITITSSNHGLRNGELVEILGIKRTAGIPSATLNGSFNITFVNTSQFSYEVNINAIESLSGGGNVVKTGKQALMQLLWDDYSDSVGPPNLGYPSENSSELLNTSLNNPILTKTLSITDVEVGDPLVITSPNHNLLAAKSITIISISVGNPTEITTLVSHGLITGDKVYIADTNSTPVIDILTNYTVTVTSLTTFTIDYQVTTFGNTGVVKIGGEKVLIEGLIVLPPLIESNTNNIFLVEENASDPVNKFNIDTFATAVTGESIPSSFIGTSQLTITHLSHGFNTVIAADNNGSGIVKVTTSQPHLLTGTVSTITAIVAGAVINTVDITIVAHALFTGDSVTISGSDSVPTINGIYYITRVDDDIFTISLIGGVTTPGTTGTVKNGSQVTINGSDSTPSIDSTYSRIEYVSAMEFNIYNEDPGDIFPTGLSVPAATGILGITNDVTFYRIAGETEEATAVASVKLASINNKHHEIQEIVDADNYMIRVADNYATETKYVGESETRVHSEKHGMDFKQTNTTDGEVLNKSVSLEGENYVFMTVPTLGEGTITSSSGLDHIFAKILLSEPPNTLMFNTFLSNAKIYEDSPLATLNELQFEIRNNDSTLYNFNDIDYSFSLEIIEFIDVLEEVGYSSRRGIKDFSSQEGQALSEEKGDKVGGSSSGKVNSGNQSTASSREGGGVSAALTRM